MNYNNCKIASQAANRADFHTNDEIKKERPVNGDEKKYRINGNNWCDLCANDGT